MVPNAKDKEGHGDYARSFPCWLGDRLCTHTTHILLSLCGHTLIHVPHRLMETSKLLPKFCFIYNVASFCTSPSVAARKRIAFVLIENAWPTSQMLHQFKLPTAILWECLISPINVITFFSYLELQCYLIFNVAIFLTFYWSITHVLKCLQSELTKYNTVAPFQVLPPAHQVQVDPVLMLVWACAQH